VAERVAERVAEDVAVRDCASTGAKAATAKHTSTAMRRSILSTLLEKNSLSRSYSVVLKNYRIRFT
jgi:hypothetical protein